MNGPFEALLVDTCVGCHTGVNDGTNSTPYVLSPSPTYDATGTESNTTTLAGGNFFWVTQNGGNSFGHNVSGISGPDSALLTPPGFDGGRAAADGTTPGNGTWPSGQQLTCAGVYGCHGTHDPSLQLQTEAVRGGHHEGAAGSITAPGTTTAGGYRMLVGIAGYEDLDWEFRPTSAAHNQYKGVDNPGGADDSTISSLCAQCHGLYHNGPENVGGTTTPSSSPWIRHPTDFDMGNTEVASDYRSYGGSGHTYQVVTPVGSNDVSVPLSTINFTSDTAIVTCISCHRAHGSPYYKMMRWDYSQNSMGGFCANCHTSKN